MRKSRILKCITTLFLIGVMIKYSIMVEGISGKMLFSWRRSKAARSNILNRYTHFENKLQTTTSHSSHINKNKNNTCIMKKRKNTFDFVTHSKSKHCSTYTTLTPYYIISIALQNLVLRLLTN